MIESMMVAERSEFLADNPGNKGNGTVRVALLDMAGNLSSVFPAIDMVTSILRYWLYCEIKRKNATDLQEPFIPRDLRRNRWAMCLIRYTVIITPRPV